MAISKIKVNGTSHDIKDMNAPVKGEMLYDDNYKPDCRSEDALTSSSDVGFYIGNGFSLIVTEGSEYGDYSTINQIKITNRGAVDATPSLYARKYHGAQKEWSDWEAVAGPDHDKNVACVKPLASYDHDNNGIFDDDAKSNGIYLGDNYTLFVSNTSSYSSLGQAVLQIKCTYSYTSGYDSIENVTPELYQRVWYSQDNKWTSWTKVGEYNLTVGKLTEVIPDGFGSKESATSPDFDNTYYYFNTSTDSPLYPSVLSVGDVVTLKITNISGTTTTKTCTVTSTGSNIILNFDSGITLTLHCYDREVTYELQGASNVSSWNYSVTHYNKINSAFLPDTSASTALYEHTYGFKHNMYEDTVMITLIDKYSTHGSSVSTIMSNLSSRYNGKYHVASGYSNYCGCNFSHVKFGNGGFETYGMMNASLGSGAVFGGDTDYVTLLFYSDRALS